MTDIDEAVAAVQSLEKLDREVVRATFEERFTAERMAVDYLAIYRDLPGLRRAAMRVPRIRANDIGLRAVA